MNVRLAKAVVSLYPAGWRERYGHEFVALLEELPATPSIVADASLRALPLRLRSLAIVAGAVICAGLPAAAGMQHPPEMHLAARTYSLLPNDTACRRYSSVTSTGSVRERQCSD